MKGRFWIFVSFFLVQVCIWADSSSIIDKIPHNPKEVEAFVEEACGTWESNIQAFLCACEAQKPFAITMRAWDRIGQDFMTTVSLLKILGQSLADKDIEIATRMGMGALQRHLIASLDKHHTKETLISYLEKAYTRGELNTETCHVLTALVKDQALLSSSQQERLLRLASYFDLKERPFVLAQGEKTPKKERVNQFTLLSWNICGLPQMLPLFAGGVLPIETRLKGILDKIKEVDPDVICLQEVFDPDLAEALYQALKGHYADFCVRVDPTHFGLTPTSITLSSGLFIASKVPFEKCEWHPFQHNQYPLLKRGFFCFDLSFEGHPFRLLNTHLEASLDDPTKPSLSWEYRVAQLNEILRYAEGQPQEDSPFAKSYILCGDLNIYWGNSEPAEEVVRTCFEDPYNKGRKECTLENCTHSDFAGYWWPHYARNDGGQYSPKPWILDYVLLLSKLSHGAKVQTKCTLQTTRVPTGDPYQPAQALSDHHALLSVCSFN